MRILDATLEPPSASVPSGPGRARPQTLRAPRRVGLASTRIVFDAERGQLAYEVVEPQWGPAERAAAETL
ncbi:MAG: hypothetical protein ACREBT_06580, partial [Thermoplasmata archaeon]